MNIQKYHLFPYHQIKGIFKFPFLHRMIALASPSQLSIYDTRNPLQPLHSFSLETNCSVQSMCWNHPSTVVSLNCGEQGIYLYSIPCILNQTKPAEHLSITSFVLEVEYD